MPLPETREAIATESPELDAALVDPRRWADEGWLHAQFAWLRAKAPVRRMVPEGFEPFWSVARHADVKAIEGEKRLFINDPRPILAPKMTEAIVRHLSGRRHLVRSLVQMDDPDHRRYRALTQGWFMGSNLQRLAERIDALAAEYVERLAEFGGRCDFVKDISTWYPLRVIMTILGVPAEDEPMLVKLTQELFGASDPDEQRAIEPESLMDVVGDFEAYFRDLTHARRAKPTDDVASVIANARIDGEPIPEHETNGYYTIIATAGHDSTSSATAGGLLALIEHPAELAKLRAAPERYMAGAVDEMIRYVTPVRQFCRTATADCTVGEQAIAEGDSCVVPLRQPRRGRIRGPLRLPGRSAGRSPSRLRLRPPCMPGPALGADGNGGVLPRPLAAAGLGGTRRRAALLAIAVRWRAEDAADSLRAALAH